jgi:hypothetical protein
MMQFDSTDVEVEKRSDEVFETLDIFSRLEIVRAGCVRLEDDEEALSEDVCRALVRRCRAWYAANTPEGT